MTRLQPARGSTLVRFWRRLGLPSRRRRIATAAHLQEFLSERAALIAQKCAIDYCRGKTGLASYALFEERPFIEALDRCRWETFAAVLSDLLVVTEGELREHAATQQRPTVCDALLRIHDEILDSYPAPQHRPHGWSDAVSTFRIRLQAASAGPPQRALDVADHSARRLFDTLPIHMSMRELDEEVVHGAVRFRMIAVSQELQHRADAAALVAELASAQSGTSAQRGIRK